MRLPLLLLLSSLNAAAQNQSHGKPQPQVPQVRIGVVAPLSGASAHLGKDIENGARMAIDDLNATGPQIGGRNVQFVLQVEDDAGDPKQGTAVAQKLVDAEVAGVVGHLNSGTSVPASRIYAAAGIAQITPAATTPLYTRQGFQTAFRLVANDNKIGEVLGRYAVHTLKARRIAVIDDRTAFGQGLADAFLKGVRAQGTAADAVSRQYTTDRATDFNAILTQIKARQPDLIFFGGMDAVAGPMLKQMKTLGLDVRLLSGDGICAERLPQLAGDALADNQVTCAVAGGVTGNYDAGYRAFVDRYQQRFKLPLQTYAPYAYDAVMLLAKSMQAAGTAVPKQYLPELAKIKYQGVTGAIGFDRYGDLANPAVTLYTYRGGRKTRIDILH
ncbi:UNVERIFIED_ORG: branched-chain amino acid transport system substrate-binding protein [Zoogloea ramigera]|uniref:Branched-chain amino acid ABC transporter substrate-binding protein n=1 Tax=Duganella zoogloeoides TaxID=75659 RepID=A0ABZ0XXH7_9BURK|nr:branched-chain amino acid ABC transporter substrate-binding protein [Duganella zoogloeoides]WQH03907.1 branched-chain amino acid ABC transporter substrate-binding protein [Duganella zoogloeoides]